MRVRACVCVCVWLVELKPITNAVTKEARDYKKVSESLHLNKIQRVLRVLGSLSPHRLNELNNRV